MSNNTQLDFINLPRITVIPNLKHFEFDLGSPGIKISDIPNQTKIRIIPNPIFKQKRKEWHERHLKREQKITELYEQIDKLCTPDNPDSVMKTELELLAEKTDGYFKLETIKKYLDRSGAYHEKNLEGVWMNPIDEQAPYWDKDYWLAPELRTRKPILSNLRWNDQVDGKWFSNKEPMIYPKDKKWIEPRNTTITNIRYKHMMRSKSWHSYGNFPPYVYKSPKDKQMFLQEVKEHVRKAEPRLQNEKTKAVKYTDDIEVEDIAYSSKDLRRCEKEDVLD